MNENPRARRAMWARRLNLTWGGALLLAVSPLTTYAVPSVYDPGALVFTTSGQSMWAEGTSTQLSDVQFYGAEWTNKTNSIGAVIGSSDTTIIPAICVPLVGCSDPVTADTRTGAEVGVKSSGQIGFNLGYNIDSGSVDSTVSYAADLTIPGLGDLVQGDIFSLNPNSQFAGVQSLETTFPTMDARIEAVMGLQANFFGLGCFIGLGCDTEETGNLGFDTQTIEVVSFNEDRSGGVEYFDGAIDPASLGLPDILSGFPVSVSIPASPTSDLATITFHLPQPDTATSSLTGDKLVSSGQDDLIDLFLDVDNIIATFGLGLPGLFGQSVSAGPLFASYDLIDVQMGPTLDLAQNFELEPTLMVDLTFSKPVEIAATGELVDFLSLPFDMLPDFRALFGVTEVTPEFWIRAPFSNSTFLDFDVEAMLTLLAGRIGWSGIFDLGFEGLGLDFAADLFSTPAIFSDNFDLGGWNRIVGQSFTISVPEPATLALLGLGLLVIGFDLRRRQDA